MSHVTRCPLCSSAVEAGEREMVAHLRTGHTKTEVYTHFYAGSRIYKIVRWLWTGRTS